MSGILPGAEVTIRTVGIISMAVLIERTHGVTAIVISWNLGLLPKLEWLVPYIYLSLNWAWHVCTDVAACVPALLASCLVIRIRTAPGMVTF